MIVTYTLAIVVVLATIVWFRCTRVQRHRIRRFLASGSPVLFTGGIALGGLAIATSSAKTLGLNAESIWSLLAALIILLLFQMFAEYRKRTYDPTLALRFLEEFDGDEMHSLRAAAAQTLKGDVAGRGANVPYPSELDDVIDFFETIAFYMQGDQITPETAHHAFYYWIRGYYYATEGYLKDARSQEPSTWEYVKLLFDMTSEIERHRAKKLGKTVVPFDVDKIVEFLDEEICLESD
jgi:hypothetical protein